MTDKSTVLQRVRDVHLHLDSSNQIVATMSGRRVDCGARGLAILDAFAEPRSITSVMQSLPVAGAQDWANIGATIVKLQAAGILLSHIWRCFPRQSWAEFVGFFFLRVLPIASFFLAFSSA